MVTFEEFKKLELKVAQIKQFVPAQTCLSCQGCCRFSQKDSAWSPRLLNAELDDFLKNNILPGLVSPDRKIRLMPNPEQGGFTPPLGTGAGFICPLFSPQDNKCKVYASRPFECQLYPFLINRKTDKVFLALDLKCPYAEENLETKKFKDYVRYLTKLLDTQDYPDLLKNNPQLIQAYPDKEVLNLVELDRAGGIQRGRAAGQKLNRLALKDKRLFDKFLRSTRHELCVYAFENIYIWRGLYDIYWKIIKDSLCVFFRDKIGCFLYIPPQGNKLEPEVIEEAFEIMDRFNCHKDICRIENVEAQEISFYRDLGYDCRYKSCDYLCNRTDLVNLKGNQFKSKRASFNYFAKHYRYEYLAFSLRFKKDCLQLYNLWTEQRRGNASDPLYQDMLRDSRICLKILLDNYRHLDLAGKLVRIDNEIRAFSFGFKLNSDTFCILYEITDLSVKGLAQFIFRSFCSELKDYKYINIMDDLGVENLKKVKLSYHPKRLIPAYVVKKQ